MNTIAFEATDTKNKTNLSYFAPNINDSLTHKLYYQASMELSIKKAGFSLVELSIVLVILGLLTGGILTGQSLIRAAELRDLSTQISKFQTTAYTFRDKYFYLPGDMPNATDFWGAADSSASGECGTPTTDTGTGTQTCNGDGNGFVDGSGFYERFRYWQHLANADMIEGTYTGTYSGADHKSATPGVNAPAIKLGGGSNCMAVAHYGITDDVFPSMLGWQSIMMGGTAYNGVAPCVAPFLTTQEAWSIDKKLDDGKPGIGKVVTADNTGNPLCASSDDENTAVYQVDLSNGMCVFVAKMWQK